MHSFYNSKLMFLGHKKLPNCGYSISLRLYLSDYQLPINVGEIDVFTNKRTLVDFYRKDLKSVIRFLTYVNWSILWIHIYTKSKVKRNT